jgi:hypothetical protein
MLSFCCPAGGDNTLVGLITYDASVHFYSVSKGQSSAQMLVMADVTDVYAPMSSNLLAKLSEAREQLAEQHPQHVCSWSGAGVLCHSSH